MNKVNIFKCPLCHKSYVNKNGLYEHLEKKHKEELCNLPPAQFYFNWKNKKDGGKCIICRKPTDFNLTTERYERICNNPSCKKKFREMFVKRMMKVHGKSTLLNDPEVQRKMLEHRKISGTYNWSNSKFKIKYVGKFELDFLEFCDKFLGFPPETVIECPIVIDYKYNNKTHFYIPDFYIPSLNLIIEIKSTENKHYRLRDIEQEKAKDKAVLSSKEKYRYFKVTDKTYDDFFNYLMSLINSN